MKTVFYLIRHASHGHLGKVLTGRAEGVPLSAKGLEEARALARQMKGRGLDALYASPRLRVQQTAELIGRETGALIRVADELDEIDFGRWSGRSFRDLARDPEWQRWNDERDSAETPAGETMADVAARFTGLIERLLQNFPGGKVALVGHSDVIKAGICHYLKMPFSNVHELEVAPASITTLAVDRRGAILLGLNTNLEPVEAGACA